MYKPNGEPRLLEEGMCLTIEPGLYFGSWRPDVDCPERYSNLGIRIEDDVLITSEGPEVLTAACPKTIDDIESIVGISFEVWTLSWKEILDRQRSWTKENSSLYRLTQEEAVELYKNALSMS